MIKLLGLRIIQSVAKLFNSIFNDAIQGNIKLEKGCEARIQTIIKERKIYTKKDKPSSK